MTLSTIFLLDLRIAPIVRYFMFYFSIGFWNFSDSVVFFVLFFYWILDLFWQCGIFCFIFRMDLGTVPTVWYFLLYFSIGFWNCSDSVIFFVLFFHWILDLFWQCDIFCFIFLMDLGTFPTVWYFLFYFSIGSRNCSDSVVFFVLFYLLDLETVRTVCFYFLFFSNGSRSCSDGAVFFVLFF